MTMIERLRDLSLETDLRDALIVTGASDAHREVAAQIADEIRQRTGAVVEVVADYEGTHSQPEFAARRQDVLEMVSRRPCTVEDIAGGLGLHRNEVVKYVDELVTEGKLVGEARDDVVYYKAVG